jgi:hypothetical protein
MNSSKKSIKKYPLKIQGKLQCRTGDQSVIEKRLEVVSKTQIRFKGKAQADRESAAYMGM